MKNRFLVSGLMAISFGLSAFAQSAPPIALGLPVIHKPHPVLGLPVNRPPVVVGLPVRPQPTRPPVLGLPVRPPVGIGPVHPPVGLPIIRTHYRLNCSDWFGAAQEIRTLDLNATWLGGRTFAVDGTVIYAGEGMDPISARAEGTITLHDHIDLVLPDIGQIHLREAGGIASVAHFEGTIDLYGRLDKFGLQCTMTTF